MKSSVTINGKRYELGPDDLFLVVGREVRINSTVVDTIGNVEQVKVEVAGDPVSVTTNRSVVVTGSVNGAVSTQGSVRVEHSTSGPISTQGKVEVGGNVMGDISTMGKVEVAGSVAGRITTMGSVRVGKSS